MAKEKVTLTLDSENLAALRAIVGGRSLSSSVDQAIEAHVARLRHFTAVDALLVELDAKHGPIPAAASAWAARVTEDWAKRRAKRRKAG